MVYTAIVYFIFNYTHNYIKSAFVIVIIISYSFANVRVSLYCSLLFSTCT